MGRRAVDKNAIADFVAKAKEENYRSEEQRKQELKDSVKVDRPPHGYSYVTNRTEKSKPSPSNFVMRWVDSRKTNNCIVTSSGKTFLP